MATLTHKNVYMEMLEASANALQEPTKMWHKQVASMARGEHSKRVLAHCAQPHIDKSHIKREFETRALTHAYGILRETTSA